jgi:hypothetical protein
MNIRRLIKEQLNRQQYLYTLNKAYGDEEVSEYYLDNFCDGLNKMNEHGGEVYRLVYAQSESEITEHAPGTHWTAHKETLMGKVDPKGTFVLKGKVLPGSIDIEQSVELFTQNPEDEAIVLVRYPQIQKQLKVK